MKMKTFDEIKAILEKNKDTIRDKFKVDEIGIFGSYVKDEQTDESDVDILVTFREPVDFFLFLHLEEYLKDLIGIKVDLVTKKALKPYIGEEIFKEMMYV
jgi:uncharacterized protein